MFGTDRRSNVENVVKLVVLAISIVGLVLFEKAVLGVEYTSRRNEILAVVCGFFAYLYSISSAISALLLILIREPVSEDVHKHPRLTTFGLISILAGVAIDIQLLYWAVVIQSMKMGIVAIAIAAVIAISILAIMKISR